MADNLVEIRNLVKQVPVKGGLLQRHVATVNAVADVDLDIRKGETVGLVGESGCGKTTLGRMLVRLLEPTSGTISFDGEDITHVHGQKLKRFRRRMQFIFQDPYGSLDPRTQVGDSIAEGLRLHGVDDKDERHERVTDMLELVGLRGAHSGRAARGRHGHARPRAPGRRRRQRRDPAARRRAATHGIGPAACGRARARCGNPGRTRSSRSRSSGDFSGGASSSPRASSRRSRRCGCCQ